LLTVIDKKTQVVARAKGGNFERLRAILFKYTD